MANKIFKQVAMQKPRSNTFDLSHDRKQSLDFGNLVPFLCIDTIPGDKFNIQTSSMVRFAPMVHPIMHKVNIYTHYFFVPNRLLWENWGNFITGGEDGLDTSVFPTFSYGPAEANTIASLYDYMGLPRDASAGASGNQVSALPFAAYQMIYNEYYRDQNLIDPVEYEVADGNNNALRDSSLSILRKRSWQHDYFTSALPFTQKGPEATIPLAQDLPILFQNAGEPSTLIQSDGNPYNPAVPGTLEGNPGGIFQGNDGTQTVPLQMDNTDSLYIDVDNALAASINDLRRAFRLQEWLEKNARGGSRYTESIYSQFGVESPDSRLMRPEYLGGGKSPVTFSEVLQTSMTKSDVQESETPLGEMAGHGISVGQNHNCSYYCQEHGYIIGIMSVMPKGVYQQGIPKHFLKNDKFDWYWPSFANIGEQPIEHHELYFDSSDPERGDTFGYTPRYAEYKFINSSVHGDFRDTLDKWHLGRKFASKPLLNQNFIEMDKDEVSRIFAVTTGEFNKLYAHIFNQVHARRLMPVFGIPTI